MEKVLYTIILSATIFILSSCTNYPPSCNITKPNKNEIYELGEIINIEINAYDEDGEILEIRIYIDGKGIGIIDSPPYIYHWDTSNYKEGKHSISIKVEDDNGNISEDEINIEIQKTIYIPEVQTYEACDISCRSAYLMGEVIDDGRGEILKKGFYWSTENYYPSEVDNEIIVEGGGLGTFSYHFNNLEPYTVYYFRAFVINKAGIDMGFNKQFKTEFEINYDSFKDTRDNMIYKTVIIGSQTWFAENLAYLPKINQVAKYGDKDPKYFVYGYSGYDLNEAKTTDSYKIFGVLYNWPAAKNACPNGWHLPTDEEWIILEKYIGFETKDLNKSGWFRGYDQGYELKSKNVWIVGSGSDYFGFCGLPGGFMFEEFHGIFSSGNFWTSTETNGGPWYRILGYDESTIGRYTENQAFSISVRCIKN